MVKPLDSLPQAHRRWKMFQDVKKLFDHKTNSRPGGVAVGLGTRHMGDLGSGRTVSGGEPPLGTGAPGGDDRAKGPEFGWSW